MFLLDTNILSNLRRRDRLNSGVAAWVNTVHPSDLFLSAITILEVEIGAHTIHRRDPEQARILRDWISGNILPSFAQRILPVDTAVAQRCALLHVPDPKAERDALIAATALVHRLKVVTRNVRDFQPMGVDLINPWTAQ
jgi:predicted nucleic acid-binding protein